jgi:putative hydrolase of the HAD superfamily
MVLTFDLDDTLYDEMTFVISGLRAVARFGEASFGWNADQSLHWMQRYLLTHGRGRVFDEWLNVHGRHSRTGVETCIRVYRHHEPEITLFPSAAQVLEQYYGRQPMYLVTDGHKVVQQKKIEALSLSPMIKRAFITHRFGIRHAKPSLYCFELIRRAERCDWSEMVYVGDNPAKDFVNLNLMGALTVRVRTGSHASLVARPGYDARVTIPDLVSLRGVIDRWKK